jgi:hypothetical protein
MPEDLQNLIEWLKEPLKGKTIQSYIKKTNLFNKKEIQTFEVFKGKRISKSPELKLKSK